MDPLSEFQYVVGPTNLGLKSTIVPLKKAHSTLDIAKLHAPCSPKT